MDGAAVWQPPADAGADVGRLCAWMRGRAGSLPQALADRGAILLR